MKKLLIALGCLALIGCIFLITRQDGATVFSKEHEIKCWSHITRGIHDPMPPVTYNVYAYSSVWLFKQADGLILVYHDLNGEIQFIPLVDNKGNIKNECGVN